MKALNFATIVPVRADRADEAEIMTQMLFSDTFEVLDTYNQWRYIKTAYDHYEGWIDEKVVFEIPDEEFNLLNKQQPYYSTDIVSEVIFPESGRFLLPMGSVLPHFNPEKMTLKIGNETGVFNGNYITGKHNKAQVLAFAFTYENSPYLWGGKTHFGLDCSGLTQMAYKICGHHLLRNAKDQVTQGISIKLSEAEPGDLAFFTNDKGKVIHVGFLLGNGTIFHSHGNAHIDDIDEKGIWSRKFQRYSHWLSDVKRII